MNKTPRAYYAPDGTTRHPKEIRAVLNYGSDGLVLVMFRDGWSQWVPARLVDVAA